MIILGIETSCDETSIAFVRADGASTHPHFELLSHALHSQIDLHAQYGGVFPEMAKRAHAENLVPIFAQALEKSGLKNENVNEIPTEMKAKLKEMLEREPILYERLIEFTRTIDKPAVDAIAVTIGPGLPPALWVGVNFARALSILWNIPIVGVNHMEGHILSVLMSETANKIDIQFPAVSLLISGGHTEIVYMKDIDTTEKIGQTRDDAIGEAFDKVARMLDLEYPGGPKIGMLASAHRKKFPVVPEADYPLPRPMINTKDYDFSFSGIKTAVLYTLKKIPEITEDIKESIAREFEDAVTEVIVKKTISAMHDKNAQALIIGGGVIASPYIRSEFTKATEKKGFKLFIPDRSLSTDNAVMIAMAGYRKIEKEGYDDTETLRADSRLSL